MCIHFIATQLLQLTVVSSASVNYSASAACDERSGSRHSDRELHVRFAGLLMRLNIIPPSDRSTSSTKDLGFDDDIFLMAAALDPNFGFRWLVDLPGSMQAKEELRQHITGIVFYYCAHSAL